jgi:hypothetical protein
MNILYIAQHNNRNKGNDEEGAIYDALTKLGQNIHPLNESQANQLTDKYVENFDCILFHQINADWPILRNSKIKRVLWHWDEITDYQKIKDLLFDYCIDKCLLTYGPCAENFEYRTNKVDILRQGFDQRYIHKYNNVDPCIDIGIFGTIYPPRISFIEELQKRFKVEIFGLNGNFVHGEALERLIKSVKIWPMFDCSLRTVYPHNYWSNRPYLLTGMGGFILHPFCYYLTKEFEEDKEMVFYQSREEMYDKIRYYLGHPEERMKIAEAGHIKTISQYTYVQRCAELLKNIS